MVKLQTLPVPEH